MIVLDTNVVSEAMKPNPDPVVRAWLNKQAAQTLYLTSVTLAELWFGIATLADCKRRNRLDDAVNNIVDLFDDRTLPFDTYAARRYADLAAAARSRGLGLPLPDGYIAAIAADQGFKVASRDIAPFEAAGVPVINPWDTQRS